LIVLGCNDGQVILLKNVNNFERIEKLDVNRQRKSCIADIKFSPVNTGTKMIAAGSTDCAIDFLEVSADGKLSRIGYCKQVPGPVSVIDWSTSGSFIKVIFFNVFYV
jgi:hypothetical protein